MPCDSSVQITSRVLSPGWPSLQVLEQSVHSPVFHLKVSTTISGLPHQLQEQLKKKNNLIRSIYSFGRFQHPPRWAFMSIAHNCLVPRPLSATEVVADHRFAVIAYTGTFDQNGPYTGKTILWTKNFMPRALEQCVTNMSVKLTYSLFKGWIAISTGEVIIQQVSIC